jgi:hypothetical protein
MTLEVPWVTMVETLYLTEKAELAKAMDGGSWEKGSTCTSHVSLFPSSP